MKKKIIFMLIAVIIMLGITSCGNNDSAENNEPQESYSESEIENATFLIIAGDSTHTVSMGDLLTIGGVDVSSSPRDVLREFKGVSLVNIFNHLGIDYSGAETVGFMSSDGFMSAVSIDEATDGANTFIVFEERGLPLGTIENEDGCGPFMAVIALDPFPNRWTKYLTEVIIQ